MSHEAIFSDILKPYKGLYTHLYAACGSLDSSEHLFEYQQMPDQRTLFDLSSLTKALVTVPLIYYESLSAKLSLRDKVKVWLDSKHNPYDLNLNHISMLSLLCHESGLPAWRNFWVNYIDAFGKSKIPTDEQGSYIDRSLNAQLLSHVGQFVYSDIGYLFLQRILERRHEKKFKEIFADFCEKHNLKDLLYFSPNPESSISTGYCKLRQRELYGEVHDENAFSLGGACGHAGAFASGPDLVRYIKMLLKTKAGRYILAEHELALKDSPLQPGLRGWWLGSGESAKSFGASKAIGHLGFTGTAFWLDTENDVYGVLLTNRVVSGRVSSEITKLRSQAFQFFAQQCGHAG